MHAVAHPVEMALKKIGFRWVQRRGRIAMNPETNRLVSVDRQWSVTSALIRLNRFRLVVLFALTHSVVRRQVHATDAAKRAMVEEQVKAQVHAVPGQYPMPVPGQYPVQYPDSTPCTQRRESRHDAIVCVCLCASCAYLAACTLDRYLLQLCFAFQSVGLLDFAGWPCGGVERG